MINPQDQLIQLDGPSTGDSVPLSLEGINDPRYNLSPELVDTRANKFSYAFAGTPAQVSFDQAKTQIQSGDENGLREQAASAMIAALSQKRTDAILQTINQKNGPLGPDDLKWIDGTDPVKYISPNSVLEAAYSNQYFNEIDKFAQQSGDSENAWNVTASEVPYLHQQIVDTGNELMTKREILLHKMQDIAAQVSNQSLGGKVLDWTTMNLLPFRYNIGMRGNIGDTSFFEGGFTDTNLDIQRDRLYDLPVPQFAQVFNRTMDQLAAHNPQIALAFGTAMLGQSNSDKVLNVLNDVGDIAAISGLIKGVGKTASIVKALSDLRQVAKDAIKGSASPEQTKATILGSIGDIGGAAREQATEQVVKTIATPSNTINTNPTKVALDAASRYFELDAGDIKANPGKLGATGADILAEDYRNSSSRLLAGITNMMKVRGLPLEDATRAQLDQIKATVPDRFPGIRNSVIFTNDPVLDPVSNTWNVTFGIAKKPTELFSSFQEAQNYAKARGFEDAAIEKGKIDGIGLGHYLTVTRPIDYYNPTVGDFIADTAKQRPYAAAPDSFMNLFKSVAFGRTAEDTFSLENSANRKAALYPLAIMYQLAHEEEKLLSTTPGWGAISRKQWKQLQRVLEENQIEENPLTKQKGNYYKNPQELEDTYVRLFNRTPTLAENRAYFAVKRLTETDRVLREVGLYHNMASHGAETIRIVSQDAATKQMIKSPEIVAVPRKKLTNSDGIMLFMGDSLDGSKIVSLDDAAGLREIVGKATGKVAKIKGLSNRLTAQINQMLDRGENVLYEIWDPETRPLNGFVQDGNNRIQYILAKKVESKQLDWNQVPRLGGGHFDYDYSKYIKQAIIRKENIGKYGKVWYEGDRTVMPIAYQKIADDIIPHMNAVRELVKASKLAEAKAYSKAHLPFNAEDFVSHFFPKRNPETNLMEHPRFNTDEPFMVVPKTQSIIELDNSLKNKYGRNFSDGTRSGSLARNFQIEYTGQRDAHDMFTVNDLGTRNNPDYHINDAKLVDPITVLNRGLNRIIRSSTFDQYKNYAVTNWLREAEPYLREDKSLVRATPFYTFKTADREAFQRGTPLPVLNRLMANKYKIDQFVGVGTQYDTLLYTIADKLKDATYSYLGPKAADMIVPEWLLPKLRDPFKFIRSVTFNAYLGLFSIPQLFVQNMTYANIFALTPKYAVSGTMGAFFHQLSRINRNPEIIAKLDEFATKVRIPGLPKWRPGEFTEAWEALNKTGFGLVGSEQAMLDTGKSNKIIQGNFNKILNFGQIFFKEGEQNVRFGAWYTAFKEFRDANPTGKLTNADLTKITNRADLLYGNMSTASNSVLNSSALSVMTQFYNYTLRLSELFLSKRIGNTPAERAMARARIMAVNAGMFGVPLAFGASGLPIGDWLRRNLMDNGFLGLTSPYVPAADKNNPTPTDWIENMLMEGIPATMLTLITGKNYNFGPRYGSNGFTQINEALSGDATIWNILGGASYTLGENFFGRNLAGFTKVMSSIIRGEPQNFPITPEDFVDVFRSISSVNRSYLAYTALNTGKWINNNAQFIDDIDWKNTVFSYITGLSPQEQSDVWHKQVTLSERREAGKHIEKQFLYNINLSILAQADNNPEQAEKYMTKAMAWLASGDFTAERSAQLLSKGLHGHWNLINSTNWDYYIKQVPASKADQMREVFKQLKQNPNQ